MFCAKKVTKLPDLTVITNIIQKVHTDIIDIISEIHILLGYIIQQKQRKNTTIVLLVV
jgi:hypothetical protein